MEKLKILFLLLQAVLTQQWAPPGYEVVVRLVVDISVFQRYVAEQTFGDWATRKSKASANFEADIDYFMTEVNEMYATLLPKGLNITIIKYTGMRFLTTNLFSDNVDSAVALKAFQKWHARLLGFAPDADILWTALVDPTPTLSKTSTLSTSPTLSTVRASFNISNSLNSLNKVRNFSSNTSNFNNFNTISNFDNFNTISSFDTTNKNLNSFKTIDSTNSFSIIINSLNKFNTVRNFNNFSTPSNFTPTMNSQIIDIFTSVIKSNTMGIESLNISSKVYVLARFKKCVLIAIKFSFFRSA
ncbi:hypothetical protein PoB_003235900 [Plakobranchus ocellatus]|uniref:Uncharacterized protein n=1 Tax=Plakobranchus ocellatus TaxID=259542 RepID=A0AAV4ADX3_9GAST|nr:hypothetical protein PoB_003235900 [Plakobranchus ocellatus]